MTRTLLPSAATLLLVTCAGALASGCIDTSPPPDPDGGSTILDEDDLGWEGLGGVPNAPHRKFVGNITTFDQVDAAGLRFADHWDQITPENAGKWGSVQRTAGSSMNWATLDAIYDYAEDAGLIFKQHAFVWGNQQPEGEIGAEDVRDWMRAFCERYPATQIIDVVNEPPPHTTPSYIEALGASGERDWTWITTSFEWADEFCPDAVLILNDYNNIEYGADHFIDIVHAIQEDGAPIDAIGAQAHGLDDAGVRPDRMKDLVRQLFVETGLPLYITEYDISFEDDQQQLEHYREHLPFFLETEYIHGITLWGWVYGATWSQAEHSGVVQPNGEPRPAMTWLMEELGRPVPPN